MIHFDFEDRYEDEAVVGSAISKREGVILSVAFHVGLICLFLLAGRYALFSPSPEELEQRRQEELAQQRQQQRFVFVQPRVDRPAPKPPERAELSDLDRKAQSVQEAPKPENPLPFSKGNSTERTEAERAEKPRGEESQGPPQPEAPKQEARLNESDRGFPKPDPLPKSVNGALGKAIRDFQRYAQNQTFSNPQGGLKDPGSAIQFDTKGVEFGPWVRRFIAQVKRNWIVPDAAMTFHGRVVLQFNIHRSGRITDVIVAQPSDVDAFNRAAYNAVLGSSPTEPLPPEYPDEKAFFTVTFYYNEQVN